MNKIHTTKKAVKEAYKNIVSVPYCRLQNLLEYEFPKAYTTRREGWACDVYAFANIAIVTGYAPFGNLEADYKTCRKYEEAAQRIRQSLNYEPTLCKEELENLIYTFLNEVAEGGKVNE